MRRIRLALICLIFSSYCASTFARCYSLLEVQKLHENDMFLHKKTNKIGKVEYVWVRSGTRGDIEFVYHLIDGKLCLYEKYQY